MELNSIVKVLQESPYFKELGDSDIQELASIGSFKQYSPNQVIIEENSLGQDLFLIKHGLVKVYRILEDGSIVQFAVLGSGEIIGEMNLYDQVTRSATVETIQKTEAVLFPYASISKFLEVHPKVSLALFKGMVKRLREIHQKMEDVTSLTLVERTWATLTMLAPYFTNRTVVLSHEKLAEMVGATRPRVTEALQQLHKEKKINLSYRKIHVLS